MTKQLINNSQTQSPLNISSSSQSIPPPPPTPNSPFSNISTQHSWTIGTHNTRSFTDPIKQISLFNYCHKNSIDFLGITETWLPPNHQLKDINNHYKTWTSTPTNQHIGSGVGI